jgi:hypothetical protein
LQRLEDGVRRVWRHPQLISARTRAVRFFGIGSKVGGVDPTNIVWIFGSGRSGSTWLSRMLAELPRHKVWEEPMVGDLFGSFYNRAQPRQLKSASFIMADTTRRGWTESVRTFVLNGARYVHPQLGSGHYLVIKEPNGSLGAPLLMEALPESRMVFLLRDPRDVVASVLDGARRGSWMQRPDDRADWRQDMFADRRPDEFVERRARVYLQHAGGAREAYRSHAGRKVLVRYEDLRADPLNSMRRICSALELPVPDETLHRAVEKHSWEGIPEEQKGAGKFYRKATPGGWREDLTPEQVEIVERITGSLLDEFYPEEERE